MRPTVTLYLRTRQARYLDEVAFRERTNLSGALARIIESYRPAEPDRPLPPSVKIMRHVAITPDHLAVLDRLALEWGLTRADTARRLIEDVSSQERLSA